MNRPSDDEYGSLGDLFGGFDDESTPTDDESTPTDDESASTDDADRRPRPAVSTGSSPSPTPEESVRTAASGRTDAAGETQAPGGDLPLPPGLPPEYVEAYRRGYERARRGDDAEPTVQVDRAQPVSAAAKTSSPQDAEPTRRVPTPPVPASGAGSRSTSDTTAGVTPGVTPVGVSGVPVGAALASTPGTASPSTDPAESAAGGPPQVSTGEPAPMPWRSLAILGGVALLLVLAAFGLGRLFADEPAAPTAGGGAESTSGSSGEPRTPYQGAVRAVAVTGSRASCQASSSVDAAGNPISYEPAKAHDSDLSTAWRCAGSGRGQRLTITLPEGTTVAEVGLVPGYAKTDPVSGVDRYAQNNRITRVRWRFDDGSTFVQRMSGAPGNRSMRTRRVPETSTGTVVLEILRSQSGSRNMIAVSELRIAAPSS